MKKLDFFYSLYDFYIKNAALICLLVLVSLIVNKITSLTSNSRHLTTCTIDKDCNKKTCNRLLKRDFIYIVVILFLLMVFISTFILADNDTVLAYISFASTITSVILSVLAIFMTVISEYKNENTKTKIDMATDKIEQSTSQLLSVQEKLDKNLPAYQQVVSRLDGILERIQNIETHTEKLEELVQVQNDDLKKNPTRTINPIDESRGNKDE